MIDYKICLLTSSMNINCKKACVDRYAMRQPKLVVNSLVVADHFLLYCEASVEKILTSF